MCWPAAPRCDNLESLFPISFYSTINTNADFRKVLNTFMNLLKDCWFFFDYIQLPLSFLDRFIIDIKVWSHINSWTLMLFLCNIQWGCDYFMISPVRSAVRHDGKYPLCPWDHHFSWPEQKCPFLQLNFVFCPSSHCQAVIWTFTPAPAWKGQPLLWPVTPVLPTSPSSGNFQVETSFFVCLLWSRFESQERTIKLFICHTDNLCYGVNTFFSHHALLNVWQSLSEKLFEPLANSILFLQRCRSPGAGQRPTEKRQPQPE